MPGSIMRGGRRPRFPGWKALGLLGGVALLAGGLFLELRPVAPTREAHRQAVETSLGTATDGHFTIRLLGGTTARP